MSNLDHHHRALEAMYATVPINRVFAASMAISEGHCRLCLEMRDDLHHEAGQAHGAVYFKLLDDAACFAANSVETESFLVTGNFTLYFMRPIAQGLMIAEGRLLNRSRSQSLAEAVVRDENGRDLARGSGVFLRSRAALSDVPGYGAPAP